MSLSDDDTIKIQLSQYSQTPTRGPWYIADLSRPSIPIFADGGATRVAMVHAMPGQLNVAANARLIAAAPELLDALQGLVDLISATYRSIHSDDRWSYDAKLTSARAAISKATGGAA